jgi:hypothetical protein
LHWKNSSPDELSPDTLLDTVSPVTESLLGVKFPQDVIFDIGIS